MRRYRIGIDIGIGLLTLLALGLAETRGKTAQAEPRYMFLTVTNFEAGISYRQVQWHVPIGQLSVPCSYADHFAATIDWNDGTGEHKPDTNMERKMLQTVPVVQNGTYLFWDDEHVSTSVGTQIGHDVVDLTVTLDAPAPPSGTWVKLEVTPPGNLNTLPPYVQVPQGETQEIIPNLELRKPSADFIVQIAASTVGRVQESQKLTVTP